MQPAPPLFDPVPPDRRGTRTVAIGLACVGIGTAFLMMVASLIAYDSRTGPEGLGVLSGAVASLTDATITFGSTLAAAILFLICRAYWWAAAVGVLGIAALALGVWMFATLMF